MKFKLISLILLALSLQSFAMEQGNKDGQKKEEIEETKINRNESLGTLLVLPDEILLLMILNEIRTFNYKNSLEFLHKLKLTSKKFKALANKKVIEKELILLKQHYDQLTQTLVKELGNYPRNWDNIQQLIKNGANVNVNFSDNNRTLLMVAAESGNSEIVKLLLEHSANINTKDKQGWNALALASYWHPNTEELLLQHGGAKTPIYYFNKIVNYWRKIFYYIPEKFF